MSNKTKRKPQYLIGLDYSEAKRRRLRRYCGIIGESVREFVARAIDETMNSDLNHSSVGQEIEKLLEE